MRVVNMETRLAGFLAQLTMPLPVGYHLLYSFILSVLIVSQRPTATSQGRRIKHTIRSRNEKYQPWEFP
jgi:hypothetical protein